jgi:hypothetical protein
MMPAARRPFLFARRPRSIAAARRLRARARTEFYRFGLRWWQRYITLTERAPIVAPKLGSAYDLPKLAAAEARSEP